jgi:hypothetical protein
MPISADALSQLGLFVAAALTLITLSYAVGDHPLFRVVLYLFVGVAAGYAAAVAIEDVILPQLVYPIFDFFAGAPQIDLADLAIRAVLSIFLLTKLSPRTARLGNPVTAMLAGVGAALAIAGAVQGTILPQISASATYFDVAAFDLAVQGGYFGESTQIVLQGALLLLATIGTLAYFHFGAQARGKQDPLRNIIVDALAWVGSIFIAITLATLFTGVLLAALAALIERLDFLLSVIGPLLGLQ